MGSKLRIYAIVSFLLIYHLAIINLFDLNKIAIVIISSVFYSAIFFLNWNYLDLKNKLYLPSVSAFLYVILFSSLTNIVITFLKYHSTKYLYGNESLASKGYSTDAFFITILISIVFIPILEELLFRGLIQDMFIKRNKLFYSVLFTSLVFGIIHFFSVAGILPAFIFSFCIGYFYHFYKNIILAVLFHATYNLLSILVSPYIYNYI